jgi:nicotinate-nucleotide adenylyltransferase
MRKIGIYGGTFDPVHHGHLILAREAREQLGLEQIIFVPAAASPFKSKPRATAEIRMSMLQAAIEGESTFVIDDCELKRPPPSYMMDTVSQIADREAGAEFYLLVGEDNVLDLPKWHRFDELKKLVHFVILDRGCSETKQPYDTVRRKIDISATEIRNRVASGQSILYFVPPAVEEIIRKNNLYRELEK